MSLSSCNCVFYSVLCLSLAPLTDFSWDLMLTQGASGAMTHFHFKFVPGFTGIRKFQSSKQRWEILSKYKFVPECTGIYWAVLGCAGMLSCGWEFYRDVLGCTGMGFSGTVRYTPVKIVYRNSTGVDEILPGFTRVYWGFTVVNPGTVSTGLLMSYDILL